MNKKMYDKILKSYEVAKHSIDSWFGMSARDQIMENKKNDAIQCIYCIGRAFMLASILESDFGENLKKEKLHLMQIKDYLQFDFLNGLEVA